MDDASSRIPRFRSDAYWAALGAIADELLSEPASHALRSPEGGRRALQRLSNEGFGLPSLFDLCALLELAVPREPALPGAGAPGAAPPPVAEPGPAVPPPGSIAERNRGPVPVSAHPTERQLEHLRHLEAGVAEAVLLSRERPASRSAVRRALAARGSTIRDATAVYGIVCELLAREDSTRSPDSSAQVVGGGGGGT